MQREHYSKEVEAEDASHLRVGVVVSRFNNDITTPMLEGALHVLSEWQVPADAVRIVPVPGSFEIPYGCLTLLRGGEKLDAIIALGCIIKGETEHDRHIASAVAGGITNLTLVHGVPISFGVITVNNLEQAQARSEGEANKGREAAVAALQMALLPK